MQRISKRGAGLGLLAAVAVLGLGRSAAAQQTGNCIGDVKAGARELKTADCGGFPARISIPKECMQNGPSCGIVVQFAGITLSPSITERNTNFERLGSEGPQRFVVLGFGGKTDGEFPRFNGGDSKVLRGIVEDTVKRLNLDPKRIHVSGFSQGAGIVFDFICDSRDLIASAAAIAPAGVAMPELAPDCFRDNATPIQLTQGDKDTLVPPQQTFDTRDRILAAMGMKLADGKQFASADGIKGLRFARADRMTGPTSFEFFEHTFTGATAGEGHCYPGSFETPKDLKGKSAGTDSELMSLVDTFQIGCADADQVRISVEQKRFFVEHPKP